MTTISEAAKRTGLSVYTLRYYDKEGLLPFLDRTTSGLRSFKESDYEWLSLICCLKNTGMPIKDIKQFINWCLEGDSTLKKRKEMFIQHKINVEKQMEEINKNLEKIDYKVWYYTTAAEAGTEAIHKDSKCCD